jgi:cell division septation protein DedD
VPNANLQPAIAGDKDDVDDNVDTDDTADDGVDDGVDDTVNDGVDDTVNDGVDDTVNDGVDDTVDDGSDDGADGNFWIQVASLPLKEKADRLAAQLRKKGHKAQTLAYGGPRAGWWHVVRLGPYPTRIDAESARLDFVRSEPMATVVMPRARGPYHIQIASLRSESGAKNLAARLARNGHSAVTRSVTTRKSGTWYTVRVGPFDSVIDAEAYQTLLEQHGNAKGEIVPRPKPEAAPPRDQDPASL